MKIERPSPYIPRAVATIDSQATQPSKLNTRPETRVERVNPISRLEELGIRMIEIPAGEFIFQETPGVYLPTFYISETPITNGQYERFMKETGQPEPAFWQNDRSGIKASQAYGLPEGFGESIIHTMLDCGMSEEEIIFGPRLPVVGVSNGDAEAFAKWVGCRLPTEFGWEKAARGTDGRNYPWGNEFDPTRLVCNKSAPDPVGTHKEGASPYGVLDMAGNNYEWTSTWRGDLYLEFLHRLQDPKNPKGPQQGEEKVVRSSYFRFNQHPVDHQCVVRNFFIPDAKTYTIGFRIAMDIKIEEKI